METFTYQIGCQNRKCQRISPRCRQTVTWQPEADDHTQCPTERQNHYMITSSNWNIFRVTGPLCAEFSIHRWILLTKPVARSFDVFSLICACRNGWANNREAGDLRRHRAYYKVTVMTVTSYHHHRQLGCLLKIVPRLTTKLRNIVALWGKCSDLVPVTRGYNY